MMVATNMNSKEIFDFDEHLLDIFRLASVKFLLLFSNVPVTDKICLEETIFNFQNLFF